MNDDSSSGGGEILEMLLVCEFCSNSCSLIIESMEFFLFCIFQKDLDYRYVTAIGILGMLTFVRDERPSRKDVAAAIEF